MKGSTHKRDAQQRHCDNDGCLVCSLNDVILRLVRQVSSCAGHLVSELLYCKLRCTSWAHMTPAPALLLCPCALVCDL